LLISIHLPKTAGASFRKSLKEHFGEGLRLDYLDRPINTPPLRRHWHVIKKCIRNRLTNYQAECVHGHFLPLKYALCRNAKFVAWLRDPLERLGSHYYFWLRNYDLQPFQPLLHRRVVEEQWSFERFCLAPELRNLYCQFFWGFSPKRLDFIGIVEQYEFDLAYFSQYFLNEPLNKHVVNTNPDSISSSYFEDPGFKLKVQQYHQNDVDLYKWALARRAKERG